MEQFNDNLFARIHQLAQAQLEDSLAPAEQQELQSLLLESAAARRMYVAYVQESACLRWFCLEEMAEPVELARPAVDARREARRRLANGFMRGTLACLIAIGAGGWLYSNWAKWPAENAPNNAIVAVPTSASPVGDNSVAVASASEPSQVATITGLTSAQWSPTHVEPRLLSRCRIGDRMLLDNGAAELTFDAGAQVTIFGPADFEIISPNSIRCTTGRVNALVGERGKGFTIQTPQAKVVDLGTQFGLSVSKDGETDVVVFQGIVDTSPSAAAGDERTRRMFQGEALRVNQAGEFERLMSVERNSFMVRPKDARSRSPVIAAVRDNIRKADNLLSYQIVHGGLEEDAPSFVDRFHEWNGITPAGMPAFLRGADYVMPFNNDKFVRSLQLEIDLAQSAELYVFLDKNMEVPDWLRNDFVETGEEIGLDGARTEWHTNNALDEGPGRSVDFVFSVWRRDVQKPGTVTLGGVNPPQIGTRSYGFNMYGIAAVPLEGFAQKMKSSP